MTDAITGNYFDKYGSKNPLVRWVMQRYFATLFSYIDRAPFDSVLEAGCGEGEIVRRIVEKYRPTDLTGTDIDLTLIRNLEATYPQHEFVCASLTEFESRHAFDLVLCLEVLEHIPDYMAALRRLQALNARRYIISVPNEPFFRMANVGRLTYLRHLGNTPGHVNNFTYRQFGSLLRVAFPGARVETRTCWIWSFAHIEPAAV